MGQLAAMQADKRRKGDPANMDDRGGMLQSSSSFLDPRLLVRPPLKFCPGGKWTLETASAVSEMGSSRVSGVCVVTRMMRTLLRVPGALLVPELTACTKGSDHVAPTTLATSFYSALPLPFMRTRCNIKQNWGNKRHNLSVVTCPRARIGGNNEQK